MTKYSGLLKDGTARDDAYIVELQPPNKAARRFLGFLSDRAWDFTSENCIYVGDSNAGSTYEVGSANDPVIEGHYTQYIMDNQFDTTYIYSEFEESSVCKSIS